MNLMKLYPKPIFHSVPGYEIVMEFIEPSVKLHGFIAVHNTKRGPALGGTRIWKYDNRESALTDVLRLAKGMTFKALLKGQYITAEDVNTSSADMMHIAKQTPHVVGRVGKSGNPSPFTALGVFYGIQASVAFALPKKKLQDLSFAIQGVGQTGTFLIDQLVAAGVEKITIADINPTNIELIIKKYPQLKVVSQELIMSLPVDVFSPCALGGIINDVSIDQMKAKIVAGSANNIHIDPFAAATAFANQQLK